MKALSLWQPWATLIALGHKKAETRSWGTDYRGPIAIHAAKRNLTIEEEELVVWLDQVFGLGLPLVDGGYPLGCVVATATLTDCVRMTGDLMERQSWLEIESGDWSVGRYAWFLEDVKRLDPPVPARGARGLWEWDAA